MSRQLTPEQKVVSEWGTGPLLVLSVAGSGKTFTIIQLTRQWVRQRVHPEGICVCTFSADAAAELKARGLQAGIPSTVSFRTLNSLGWSIIGEVSNLPAHPSVTRRDPVLVDPRGPNSWWVKKLLQETIKPWRRRYKDSVDLPKLGSILSEIGRAKAALIWPDAWTDAAGREYPDYRDWAVTREREPVPELTADVVEDCYRTWEAVALRPEDHAFDAPRDYSLPRPLRGRRRGKQRPLRDHVRWFSYDDQIALPARWIREGRSFMGAFRDVFERLVVDEAQDNNAAQDTLAGWVALDEGEGPNLVMVGDDQQSIYAFRGARPDLLREFRDSPEFRVVVRQLSSNFRCAARILDVGNNILAHAQERLFEGDLQLGRSDDAAKGGTVTTTEYHDASEEAVGVVDGIKEAIERGISPDDIAILTRLNNQSGPFELELLRRAIPYQVAGQSFFQRPEIRATLAYIGVALDGSDEDSFRRAVRAPARGIAAGFFKAHPDEVSAREAWTNNRRGLYRGWRKGLDEFIPHIDKIRSLLEQEEDGLNLAIKYVTETVGVREFYRDEAASDEDETDTDIAVEALLDCANLVGDPHVLLGFAGGGEEDEASRLIPKVTISTVHKAKGLEWDYVAAPGWTSGTFPFFRAPIEEERRLGYVCVTRARQYLHISWTTVDAFGNERGPSDLVTESDCRAVASACGEPAWPDLPEGGQQGWSFIGQ